MTDTTLLFAHPVAHIILKINMFENTDSFKTVVICWKNIVQLLQFHEAFRSEWFVDPFEARHKFVDRNGSTWEQELEFVFQSQMVKTSFAFFSSWPLS